MKSFGMMENFFVHIIHIIQDLSRCSRMLTRHSYRLKHRHGRENEIISRPIQISLNVKFCPIWLEKYTHLRQKEKKKRKGITTNISPSRAPSRTCNVMGVAVRSSGIKSLTFQSIRHSILRLIRRLVNPPKTLQHVQASGKNSIST